MKLVIKIAAITAILIGGLYLGIRILRQSSENHRLRRTR